MPEPPPSEVELLAQATEDCRYWRLSAYLPRDGETACIQSRLAAMQYIAALRSDPDFAAAQQACAFFRGSPREDLCYWRRIAERRRARMTP